MYGSSARKVGRDASPGIGDHLFEELDTVTPHLLGLVSKRVEGTAWIGGSLKQHAGEFVIRRERRNL
jgi:hypothetical protein